MTGGTFCLVRPAVTDVSVRVSVGVGAGVTVAVGVSQLCAGTPFSCCTTVGIWFKKYAIDAGAGITVVVTAGVTTIWFANCPTEVGPRSRLVETSSPQP